MHGKCDGSAADSVTLPCVAPFPSLNVLRLLQLIEELKVPKGPQLGQLTASVMDWQLAHPTGSKEECLAAIKQQMPQASAPA